jgi:hypothetical protein
MDLSNSTNRDHPQAHRWKTWVQRPENQDPLFPKEEAGKSQARNRLGIPPHVSVYSQKGKSIGLNPCINALFSQNSPLYKGIPFAATHSYSRKGTMLSFGIRKPVFSTSLICSYE